MPNRRQVVFGGAAALMSMAGPANAGQQNILFICIDDLISVTYNRNRFGVHIRTPNLNRLMTQGVSFSNAFCSTALCNPSRTAIFTGQNPFKTGVHDNATDWETKVNLNGTFPGILQNNGWRCFSYGKMTHRNFGVWQDRGICEESYRPKNGPNDDRDTVNEAIRRIRTDLMSRRDVPWLLMVGLRGPHIPNAEHPQLLSRYPLDQIQPVEWDGDGPPSCLNLDGYEVDPEEVKLHIQAYFADVTAMDRELGRLMTAADLSGLKFTVILTSDHGYSLGDHDVFYKFTLWDEAGRAPLIIRYPGSQKALSIPDVVSLLDIAPTILHRCGIPIPPRFDGQSLMPIVKGYPSVRRTDGTLTTMNDSVSFRDNQYRVTRYKPCDEIELYDQIADPESRDNLADDPANDALKATMLAKLDARLAEWMN